MYVLHEKPMHYSDGTVWQLATSKFATARQPDGVMP